MLLLLKNNFKQRLCFVLAVLLMIGLLYSRALLSIASLALGIVGLICYKDLKSFRPIFFAFCLILFPVIVSGFWSTDKYSWWRSVEVKLSLVTIIAGLVAANFSTKQIKQLVWVLTALMLTSAIYTFYNYYINQETILQSYLVAKVMPVLMDDDHIRYSWLIVLNIVLLAWVGFSSMKNLKQKIGLEHILITCTLFFLLAYVHFIAAKTGLLCLYVALILLVIYLFTQLQFINGLLIATTIVFCSWLAYNYMPSLKNRVQYVLYDFSNYSKGNFTEGSSDGARVLSLKAGLDITKQHFFTGVGFGDIQTEVINWHNHEHPTSKEYERFLPTNQWLIYSAGSGLLGVVCFSIGLILLLYPLGFKNIFSVILLVVLLLPLLTDDSFEGQYGISIFALVFVLGSSINHLLKREEQRFN